MSVELFDPCNDPEPPDWEAFRCAEGLTAIWAYDFIRTASEGSWSPPVLALLRDSGRVVGIVGAVYLGLRRPGSVRVPRPRREPLILDVRLPGHSYGPTWHFSAEVPAKQRQELLRQFERTAARLLGWGLTGAVYRMVTDPEVPLVARRGAVVRQSASPGSNLPVPWDTADCWLASLSTKRRANLRRRARKMDADPALTISFGPCRTDLDAGEMARMNRLHRLERDSRLDPRSAVPESHFAALVKRDDVSFLSYADDGGRLLAFATYLHHESAPQLGWWASLARDEGGLGHLYFDHYLRCVRYAIEHGATSMSAGRGALDSKTAVGFQAVPMSIVAVPRWVLG